MKKHTKLIISVVTIFSLLITSVSAATASATSTRYAYSFGVNHPSTDTLSGDFSYNVSQAYRAYA